MKRLNTLLLGAAMGMAVAGGHGCSEKPSLVSQEQTLGDVVTNLVERATAGDTNYFMGVMDESAKGQAPDLVEMIRRSGMLTNYLGRLRKDAVTQARLDYHDPDAQCHFQVDLQQAGSDWEVRRIYFCR